MIKFSHKIIDITQQAIRFFTERHQQQHVNIKEP